jgi:phosphoribosylglycinamide formyltransferase-1
MAATRIGVLLSGTGRTLQNLLACIDRGELDAQIACVISDREGVAGLEHARAAAIPVAVLREADPTFALLRTHRVDLVCMCGYLRLLPIPTDFAGRVLNIHPSLLPRYGGKGFYGARVHAAVLAAGETESGCTVHYCDDEYDRGPILLQRRVPVCAGDTADSLGERVFAAECEAYPEAIRIWQGRQPG